MLARSLAPLALCALLGCSTAVPLPPRAVELNRLGAESLDQGDLTTAEARLALALEFHPRFVEALVNLGLVELSRGNHERARALFLRARTLNEHLPHPHHGLGALAQRQQRLAEAAAHYREALKVDPAFAPSRANLGRLLFDAGSLDESRAQFLRLIEVNPADGRGHAGLIEALLRLGRRDDADRALDRARALAPASPEVRLLGARRALDQGRVGEARRELLGLLRGRHQVLASVHAWLAVADLADGAPRAAVDRADQALALDQHEPVATYAMARALTALDDPAAAAWRRRVDETRGRAAPGPWPR